MIRFDDLCWHIQELNKEKRTKRSARTIRNIQEETGDDLSCMYIQEKRNSQTFGLINTLSSQTKTHPT